MDLKNIFILISAGLNLFLGFLVYTKGKDKITNKVYSLVALSVFYWSIGMILYRLASNVSDSVFWCRVLYTAPILIVCSLLYFVYVLPKKENNFNKWAVVLVIISSFILEYLTFFTDSIIKNVILNKPEKEIIFGINYLFYFAFITGFFIWIYSVLYIRLKKYTGIIKTQIVYVFLSTVISSLLSMLSNLLLPTIGTFFLNWAGQVITSFFMLTLIAYAIVVHRLMDIKFVLRRYSVFLASLTFIIIIAIAIKYIVDSFFIEYTLWADFFILVGALFIYPYIKDYFYKLANKYFFSSLYDSGEVIAGLSEKLRSTLDIRKIYQYIAQTLINAFHIKAVGLLSYNEKAGNFNVLYNNGFKIGGHKVFPGNPELQKLFMNRGETMIVEEVKRMAYEKYKETLDLLTKLKVEVLTPLNLKNKTIGLIALGTKESADIFNDEDLKVLKVVGAQAAIAIENALLYEETKNFSLKLEKEVEKATRDLRRANIQLKKLDAAKSDFISIASHQLRTPLTVIKGYISMMLEGSFGKLTEAEKDSLGKVFESNERLINLVENLLNISRIESGRLQFNLTEVRLEKVVASVVEELTNFVKRKDLYLNFTKPEPPLPNLKLDEEKIRQVMLNLVDNAIKYTSKGGVTVDLELVGKTVRFCVADTGLGMAVEDLPNLFKKFSRGSGTSLVHTEGTGLGLYVAKMMIEAHHGRIWAESPGKDQGAKFCFEIPINS